jgi:hypothetical protein
MLLNAGRGGLRAVCFATSRLPELATQVSGEPGQRCECEPLKPAWSNGALHFALERAREEREVEWSGDAAEHRAALLGKCDGGLEALLLDGVEVERSGDASSRGELELDRNELAVRLKRRW